MLKIILFFLISGLINILYPQNILDSYSIGEEKKLNRISAENPASNSISDILTKGDTVWLGTGRGVSLSTDGGENWTNFNNHPAFESRSISAIGYDSLSGTFWAAKAYLSEGVDGRSEQTGGGLVYTTDLGNTWNSISQPMDDPGDSLLTYGINDGENLPFVRALPITVPQNNLTFDIAFTYHSGITTIWTVSWAGGLRKSTDKGATWQRVLLPSDILNSVSPEDTINYPLLPVSGKFGTGSLNHRAFSVIAIEDTILYVGTAGGINKSTDNGISWRKFNNQNQVNSISGNFVVALGFNQFNNTVWGATWRADDSLKTEFYGVSSSTDGGENWSTFLEDERVHNFGFKGNDVIAASDNGAFRSADQGKTWILPTSIIDPVTQLELITNIFYSAASEGNLVWLGSADGLARLNETGIMWNGEWKTYFASRVLTSENEVYCYPNPFSPKIDEGLKFKYSTNNKVAPVTIRIFDFAMNYVRTLIQNAERQFTAESSPDPVRWDGQDDNGKVVPNGVYFYRIDIGSEEPLFGKIIVLQ